MCCLVVAVAHIFPLWKMKQSFSLFDASSDSKHEFMKKRNNLANVGKVTKKKLFCNKETHFHSRLHEKISPLGVSSILFPSPWRWNKMRKTCFWCELYRIYIKSLILEIGSIISNFSFRASNEKSEKPTMEPIWNDKRAILFKQPSHCSKRNFVSCSSTFIAFSPTFFCS